MLRYIYVYLLLAKNNISKAFHFITPTFIGYRYITREITDANDKQFTLHIIDELYRFCGITIYNESYGFENENDLWEYVFKNNCDLVCFPDRNNLVKYREQQMVHMLIERANEIKS